MTSNEKGLSGMAKFHTQQARAAFDANRANLCSHGVKREACNEHKPGTEETPDA